MARSTDAVLTIAEAAALVRAVDSRALQVTPRQLRYWEALGLGLGRTTEHTNAARLFSLEDVALVRLIRRLQRDGVAPRAIWALLVVQGDALRRALRTPGRVLWLEQNGRAHFLSRADAASKPARECYPLAEVLAGLPTALRTQRAAEPDVWAGAALVPAAHLVAAHPISTEAYGAR